MDHGTEFGQQRHSFAHNDSSQAYGVERESYRTSSCRMTRSGSIRSFSVRVSLDAKPRVLLSALLLRTTQCPDLTLFALGSVSLPYSAGDGFKSFKVFRADASSDFQRTKSATFSVTRVACARTASPAINRSRKWWTKSICPKTFCARRSKIPVSIHAAAGGDEKCPSALCA
jgi:hypothetical protein